MEAIDTTSRLPPATQSPMPPDTNETPPALAAFAITEVEAMVPVPAAAPHASEAILQAWWNEMIHGSEVCRHTPGINHLKVAFDELKRRLATQL